MSRDDDQRAARRSDRIIPLASIGFVAAAWLLYRLGMSSAQAAGLKFDAVHPTQEVFEAIARDRFTGEHFFPYVFTAAVSDLLSLVLMIQFVQRIRRGFLVAAACMLACLASLFWHALIALVCLV